ncbi:MAG: DUF3189 family protein [Clostridia bacterium]|nr:DUF3189 family protein [Clostridia bacterium]
MYIFYYCLTGVHTSLVTSAIHLGLLPEDRVPPVEKIINLPNYDRLAYNEIGQPCWMGTDNEGNKIFSIGVLSEKEVVPKAIQSLLDLYQIPQYQYRLVSTMEYVPYSTALGGVYLKRMGAGNLGRSVATKGLTRVYPKLVELVREVKDDLKNQAP